MKGFLGTGATFGADANLIVQAAMGAALLAGTYLARRRSYTAHGIWQNGGQRFRRLPCPPQESCVAETSLCASFPDS